MGKGTIMGNIKLSSDDAQGNTILSNTFIDHYMPEADGTFVKVYLYLLRLQQSNRPLSSFSEIADHLKCSDNDVERSIRYWISKGLIRYSIDERSHCIEITLCLPMDPEPVGESPRIVDYLRVVRTEEPVSPQRSDSEPQQKQTVRRSRVQPSPKELTDALSDEEFIDLRKEAEAFFDRPLTQKDINALWMIYKDLALPFDLCEYLLEYCASDKENHPERMQPDYYKKIAVSWAEQGIMTREAARQDTEKHFFGTKLLRALGVRSRYSPTEAECRMIETWRRDLGFSEEMILLACDEAILTKPGSANFRYVNGILSGWAKDGLTKPAQVEERRMARSTAAQSAKKSERSDSAPFLQGSLSSDLDYLEKLAMKDIKNS